jgi:hypothetical protein
MEDGGQALLCALQEKPRACSLTGQKGMGHGMVKLSPCIPAKQRTESPHHRPRDVYPALLSWKSHTGQGADFYVPGAVLASTVRLGGGRW